MPTTSRGYANLQHLVGGLATQMPIISAFFIGTKNYWMAGIIFLLGFLFQRASSEISYHIQKHLNMEYIPRK
jgi:hypothetical protein